MRRYSKYEIVFCEEEEKKGGNKAMSEEKMPENFQELVKTRIYKYGKHNLC